jgi:SPP1 gp7 family putative phage head morphogenesis protein
MLSDGITNGLSKKDIRAAVNKKYRYDDKVENRFDRLIRGMGRVASQKLKLLKWQDLGFTHFEWRTKEDDVVRPAHVKKNRKVFSISDALKALDDLDAYPGKNYGCRCWAVVAY